MGHIVTRALHLDSSVPNQPLFDTLVGVCNPFAQPQEVVLRALDMRGEVVPGELRHVLEPGHSFATTFIRNNVFADPPQNWQGILVADFPGVAPPLPTMACLGGNGPTPKHWNYATPNVPILYDSRGVSPMHRARQYRRWVFPYAIPYFRDAAQHADEHEYRSGLSVTNLGGDPVSLDMAYTVGDFYPNAGARFRARLDVRAGESVAKQLHEIFQELSSFNSEGWVDICTAAPASLAIYLLCANRDYDYLGWGQAPFGLL